MDERGITRLEGKLRNESRGYLTEPRMRVRITKDGLGFSRH